MKPVPKPAAAVAAASAAVAAADMGAAVEAGVAVIAAVVVAAVAVVEAATANTKIVQNKKTQAQPASLVLDFSLLHTNSTFGLCGMMPAL